MDEEENLTDILNDIPDLSDFYTDSIFPNNTEVAENLESEQEPILLPTIESLETRYSELDKISTGGQKDIFCVKDEYAARFVAMAVLKDKKQRRQSESNLFIQEARIAANLEHPNIIPVHDIGVTADGKPYFTMKLVKGETLGSIIRKIKAGDLDYIKSYDLANLLMIFQKVCNALSFAHSKSIVHLDLKPENIQVGDFGEVLVLDWGLAKSIKQNHAISTANFNENNEIHDRLNLDDDATSGIQGLVKGTPGYMSPEQGLGEITTLDTRSDVYSLGAILYSILTYERPTKSDTFKDIVTETITGQIIPPMSRTKKKIPISLNAVTMKAMSRQTKNRYQTVAELEKEINSFIAGFATAAENATPIKQLLLLFKRNKMAFSLVGTGLMIFLTAFSFFIAKIAAEKEKSKNIWHDFKETESQLERILQTREKESTSEWQLISKSDLKSWESLSQNRLEKINKMPQLLQISDGAIKMKRRNSTCIIYDKPITGDVAVSFILTPHNFGRVTIFVKAANIRQIMPNGYTGGYQFSIDNQEARITRYGRLIARRTLPFVAELGRKYFITIEKTSDLVRFSVDNYTIFSIEDKDEEFSPEMNRLGIFFNDFSCTIEELDIYRLGASIKIDLLDLSKKYINKGEFDKAIIFLQEVIYNSNDKERSILANKELNRVYRLQDNNHKIAIYRRTIKANVPAWNEKGIFVFEDEIHLTLTNLGLKRLTFLKNMEVSVINVTQNPLTSFNGINLKSLRKLFISNTLISSLEELRDIKITELNVSNTKVEYLAPLVNVPIRFLAIENCEIKDFAEILNFPLEKIVLTPHLLPDNYQDILLNCPNLKVIATNFLEFQENQTVEEFIKKYTIKREENYEENTTTKSEL